MRRGFLLSDRDRGQSGATSTTSAGIPGPSQPTSPSVLSESSQPALQRAPAPQELVKIPSPMPLTPDVPAVPDFRLTLGRKLLYKNLPSGESLPPNLVTGVVLYEGMEEEIRRATCSDFPVPFTTPSPPLYKIAPVAGFGQSMIATADIARGQTILCERPLMMYPVALPGPTIQDSLQILEHLVGQVLLPANRAAVYALKNAKGPDWPSHLKGISDTNSFIVGDLPGYDAQYGALTRDISRANHSCSPNAWQDFDLRTLTVTLRARAPVRRGEQITVAYIDLSNPHHMRAEELLRRYKFECKCKSCSRRMEALYVSDMQRALLATRNSDAARADDEAAFQKWLADGAPMVYETVMARTVREMVSTYERMNGFMRAMYLQTIMEQEDYTHPTLWEHTLIRLVIANSILKNEELVRKYALMAALLRKGRTGSDGGCAAVVRAPRQTEWWGKCLKN